MIDPHIIRTIETIGPVRVLIVGDVMLDRFVYGSVERVSPEAPVPVLRFERESLVPGGAANVARNVVELGATVELIGLVGKDAERDQLLSLTGGAEGWRFTAVESDTRRTTTKTRLIAQRQHIVRLDIEDAAPASAAEEAAIIDAVRAAVGRADLVVLSDYAKGTLTPTVVAAAIAAAKSRNLPVIVDPKHDDLSRYRGADLITPNRHEFSRAVGRPCDDDATIATEATALLERTGLTAILVTRGEQGMTLVAGGDAPVHLRAEAVQVFDVSGAGDTVVATLSVLLAGGASTADAAYVANVAAGLVVAKLGTATVAREELVGAIRRRRENSWGHKVVLLDALVQQRRRWAAAGETVVFTNGCFDLLHPGHISLLRQAKAAGNRLVVGLNSDNSVRQLKGPTRPIQDQESRAHVLSALEAVDLVVIFDEQTPYELIEALKPDVLVKGADYREDQVVGHDILKRYGGRVVLARLEPGHSTTATVAQMNKAREQAE